VLAVRGCGVDWSGAAGVAQRRPRVPMPLDAELRMGSVGKVYVAAVVMHLARTGALNLDQPISAYVNAHTLAGIAGGNATLRQLLNHTGGVPDYYTPRTVRAWDWRQPITAHRVLDAVRGLPATNAPGVSYSYSNTGYHLLGLAAEQATGQSLAALLQSIIFDPSNLRATTYHTTAPGGPIHGYGTPFNRNQDTWNLAENTGADSGITAQIGDVQKMLEALFLPGGALADIGTAMLAQPVAADRERREAGYGVEIATGRDGLRLVGHTGDVAGYLTFAYAAPSWNATLVGHINAAQPEALSLMLRSSADALRAACEQRPASGTLVRP
jgi:D-alanyl-D-alanine carboxypeptidase